MNNSKTSLFLMELIIVIMFFSICGAVCVQLFFHTHQTDIKTRNNTEATIIAQNLAESFLGYEGDLEKISELFPDSHIISSNDSMYIIYNSEWETMSSSPEKGEQYYIAILSSNRSLLDVSTGGTMIQGNISVNNIPGDKEINLEALVSSPNLGDVILSQDISRYVLITVTEVH